MEEEDFFSDDDLDAVPHSTLLELEQNAAASTPKPQPGIQAARPPFKALPLASDRGAATKQPWRPPQPQPRVTSATNSAPPTSAPVPPSSDYGFDEEDVIDLDEPSMVIQPGPGSQTWTNISLRPGTANGRRSPKPALDPETEAAFAAADVELAGNTTGQWAHAPHLQPSPGDSIDVLALTDRIAQLEAEQARTRQSEQQARDVAATKQGEIAIVRANQEKTVKEYERRLAVMQKLHAEEAAKTRAELEAGRKEREKMETDNRFLQHDLAQEATRAKRVDSGKGKAPTPIRERSTPRKSKRTGLGDGFDDDEVRLGSPSRSKEKSKDATPKSGVKRKRTANDSPVAALSFDQPAEVVRLDNIEHSSASAEQSQASLLLRDSPFNFMQRLLNHRPEDGQPRTLEGLSKHFYPSDPEHSLCSSLMDKLSYSSKSDAAEDLPITVARAALLLWLRCLSEKAYAPIYLLLDLVRFALYLARATVISQLIEDAVPILMKTVETIATPTLRASKNPIFAASLDVEAQESITEALCADEVMELLLRICQAAKLCGDRFGVFWQTMDCEFMLLMMSKAQPLEQITDALKMLALSSMPSTFGPINVDAEKQSVQEVGIIDRLTTLLMEKPDVPKGEQPYTEMEVANLRIDILQVLRALCLTEHGGQLLTQHPYLMGRLVRFLDGQIYKLYCLMPPLPPKHKDETPLPVTAHALVATTINTTTRLFYHLLRTYDTTMDLNKKLGMIRGGWPKLLVSMSRIAFSEQLVLEYGIEDEVTEAAHAILDSVLSPEEGEAIVAAVETPRGSKGSGFRLGEATERDTSRAETQTGGDEDTTMSDEPG
ncbi:hypothetical protein LTR62_004341 [Meristemomyces frigidus]|uniref:DNA repair protein Rad26 n=1 Tax=Meristemomyces frigidus TaxID=1508187 RepID=A0AAN7TE51_9PEZI|nr:hypothetical protein LTR62_004341 [Meristemomyces frigidus]